MIAPRFFGALAALAAFALLAPAAQAQIREKDLASGKVKFDPEKGYIFVHGPAPSIGMFIREPTKEELDKYQADWDKAYVKAREKSVRALAIWERDKDALEEAGAKVPPKPQEVTKETFYDRSN